MPEAGDDQLSNYWIIIFIVKPNDLNDGSGSEKPVSIDSLEYIEHHEPSNILNRTLTI